MTARRVYPLPILDDDSRFTLGLVLDVVAVLVGHGYPEPSGSGRDHAAMQATLFAYLYGGER
jgi:hypothetical protein